MQRGDKITVALIGMQETNKELETQQKTEKKESCAPSPFGQIPPNLDRGVGWTLVPCASGQGQISVSLALQPKLFVFFRIN